jgi:glyoxylase I family protein
LVPNVIRSNHIGLTVSDLDRAVAMFKALFGYSLLSLGGRHPRGVELLTGVAGADIVVAHLHHPHLIGIELIAYRAPVDTGRIAARPCDTGYVHLTFDVRDIDAMIEAGEAFGLTVVGRVVGTSKVPGEGQRVVYLSDPDGINIELIQPVDPA